MKTFAKEGSVTSHYTKNHERKVLKTEKKLKCKVQATYKASKK